MLYYMLFTYKHVLISYVISILNFHIKKTINNVVDKTIGIINMCALHTMGGINDR